MVNRWSKSDSPKPDVSYDLALATWCKKMGQAQNAPVCVVTQLPSANALVEGQQSIFVWVPLTYAPIPKLNTLPSSKSSELFS